MTDAPYLWNVRQSLVEFEVEAAFVRHVLEMHHLQIVQRLNAWLLKVVQLREEQEGRFRNGRQLFHFRVTEFVQRFSR